MAISFYPPPGGGGGGGTEARSAIILGGAIATDNATPQNSHLGGGGCAVYSQLLAAIHSNFSANTFPNGVARTFEGLHATKVAGNAVGVDVTLTLVVNGTPTAQAVTILAADPDGTIYDDVGHPIDLAEGDVWDYELAADVDAGASVLTLSVSVDVVETILA